jgi:caffeoyl-CoA O-methyltransferase
MKPLLSRDILNYVDAHTSPPSPLLEELEKETCATMDYPEMLTGRVEGLFLKMLVLLSGARRVLEIGTFTGYSALMMAEGLPEDGCLMTCEIDEENAKVARRFFERSAHGHKISLALGPAIDTMRSLPGLSLDFVFIDADKASYHAYYEESLRVLRPGGIMTIDNTLWSGRVLNPPDDESRVIASLNEKAGSDKRVEQVILTVRDGLSLMRKK